MTVSLHVLRSQLAELDQLADAERGLYHHSRVQGCLFQGGHVEHAMSSPGVWIETDAEKMDTWPAA